LENAYKCKTQDDILEAQENANSWLAHGLMEFRQKYLKKTFKQLIKSYAFLVIRLSLIMPLVSLLQHIKWKLLIVRFAIVCW
jgi:hypothetical protein